MRRGNGSRALSLRRRAFATPSYSVAAGIRDRFKRFGQSFFIASLFMALEGLNPFRGQICRRPDCWSPHAAVPFLVAVASATAKDTCHHEWVWPQKAGPENRMKNHARRKLLTLRSRPVVFRRSAAPATLRDRPTSFPARSEGSAPPPREKGQQSPLAAWQLAGGFGARCSA